MYPYLFSPLKIGRLTVKNRIAYPSLGLLYSYDGLLNDRYYEFFRARGAGGAGIVTVGPVGIDFIGAGFVALSLADDDAIPAFARLAQVIREGGASPWVQIFHAGRYSHPILINNGVPIGPSPVYSRYSKATPREMTLEDIERTRKAFAAAALRVKQAGFDGVEIIGSGGYLITQFLSPVTNIRTDQYGGSFENRTRFPREVLEAVRESVGPDFPMGIRMAGNDFIPGSNTDVEAARIAVVYEKAGVDVLNVTGGWHETRVPQLPMELPRAGFAFLALNVKRAVKVPVMASNRIADPVSAEAIIRDGCADMVNLGRVLIADPEWPNKAQEGREDEIRPCVACSQGCTDMVFSGRPVYCIGNPLAGYEFERGLPRTKSPKKILVAGAGPGGLEAAVTATQMGHAVSLYEKSGRIGGQLWLAGAPSHKHEILEFIRYYRAMLKKLDIPVFLNTEVDAALVAREKPDHVIVAEGAEPLVPPIKGIDGPNVLTAWEVLSNNPPIGPNVAIVGGGAVGLETAIFVAQKGTLTPEVVHFLLAYEAEPPERIRELIFKGSCSVVVFEMLDKAGKDVGRSTKWVLLDNLKRHGVEINTGTKVLSFEDGKLSWEKDGAVLSGQFDTLILASGSKSRKSLAEALSSTGVPMSVVGDGGKIGKIDDAIHGGFLAVTALG
ncbi:MAG: FAD-dependent oxidoreductase [Deltaproteobacteria bacterium]|nr:FAD-dependent oxidoreductase [Deltaproteobacteria bacterium]